MMSGQGKNKTYGWLRRKSAAAGFSEDHRKQLSISQKKDGKKY